MADLAVAILAAGQSRRFGSQDKLCAEFRGKPLGLHLSDRIAALESRFDHYWVVASHHEHRCSEGWRDAGWTILENCRSGEGMGTSVALAATHASKVGARSLLICLADMPLVPEHHLLALRREMERCSATDIVVTSDGVKRMPPAVFGARHFAEIETLDQDQGARSLLAKGRVMTCAAAQLIDIDDAEMLRRLG